MVIKITFARVQLKLFSDNNYQFWQETYRGKKKEKRNNTTICLLLKVSFGMEWIGEVQ